MLACLVCLVFGSNPWDAAVSDLLGWLFIRLNITATLHAEFPRCCCCCHVFMFTFVLWHAASPSPRVSVFFSFNRTCSPAFTVSALGCRIRWVFKAETSLLLFNVHKAAAIPCDSLLTPALPWDLQHPMLLRYTGEDDDSQRRRCFLSFFPPFLSTLACRRATPDPPPPWVGY